MCGILPVSITGTFHAIRSYFLQTFKSSSSMSSISSSCCLRCHSFSLSHFLSLANTSALLIQAQASPKKMTANLQNTSQKASTPYPPMLWKAHVEEYYSTCPPRCLDCRKCAKDPRCCSARPHPRFSHQLQEVPENSKSEMTDYQTGWETCTLHYLNCRKCPKDPRCHSPVLPLSSEDTVCSNKAWNSEPADLHINLDDCPVGGYISSTHCVCLDDFGTASSSPFAMTCCPATQCGPRGPSAGCHPTTK